MAQELLVFSLGFALFTINDNFYLLYIFIQYQKFGPKATG